jgi:hypothetical protein
VVELGELTIAVSVPGDVSDERVSEVLPAVATSH